MDLVNEYDKEVTLVHPDPTDDPGLFFITAFEEIPAEGILSIGSSRCFGYYFTFEMADEAVRENRCDLYECVYRYVVVEKIDRGIHAIAIERWFYELDEDRNGFHPIREPAGLKYVCNFAIG